MYNSVTLIGNLGGDPEIRYTPGGTAVCNFSIATTKRYKNKDGEKVEQTSWHKIVAWNKLAEICAEHLNKGQQVQVVGEIQYQEWTDKENVKRITTEINIHTMNMLGKKSDKSAAPKADAPTGDDIDDTVPF